MPHSNLQKLELDREQIRLLHVQPGEHDEPISATMSLAYLSDHPRYEALSYVWGDPDFCLDITLDGQTVPVTINLWAALRRLRNLHEDMVLWVDALCINQADEIEKSYQVRLMTEIYKNAWRGLAWLGEFEEDAALEKGVSSDAYRGSGATMDKRNAQMAMNFVEKLSKLSSDGHFTAEEEHVPTGWVSVAQPEVTALNKLMSLQWWDRIWTVQEFILPARMALVLGTILCEEALELLALKPQQDFWKHDRLYGGCCEATLARLPDFPASLLYFYDHMPSLRRIKNRQLPLTDALNRFRRRHCADPKDKIFALLGLTHPMTRQLVDYTLDKKQIYTKCVRHDITSTTSLNLLMRLAERDRDRCLPSWVPDFETSLINGPDLNMLHLEIQYILGCSLLFSAGTQRSMELGLGREDELRLGGRRVDSIRRICQRPPSNFGQNGDDSGLMPRLRESWNKLIESDPGLDLSSYPSGGSYQDAFWRTCTCDTLAPLDRHLRRCTEEDGESVKKGLAESAYGVGIGINPTKTFFISHRGYIGIGPEDTQVGDALYVLFGGHVPFVLRDIPDSQDRTGSHTFVGYAYVHGIMDGEALRADIQDDQVIIV